MGALLACGLGNGGGACCSEGCEKECMGWGNWRGGDDPRDAFTDWTPALDDGGVGRSRLSAEGDSCFDTVAFIFLVSSTERPEGKRASSCCSGAVPKRGKPA